MDRIVNITISSDALMIIGCLLATIVSLLIYIWTKNDQKHSIHFENYKSLSDETKEIKYNYLDRFNTLNKAIANVKETILTEIGTLKEKIASK